MKRRWWQIWWRWWWWRWRSHQQGARQKGCRGMLPPVEVGRCAKNFQLSIVKFQCASKFQLFWQTETESVEHFGFLSNLWSIVDAKLSWQWMQRKEVSQLSLRIGRSCFDFCIKSVLKLFILAISVSVLGISVLKAIDQPERECPGPARISCSPVW